MEEIISSDDNKKSMIRISTIALWTYLAIATMTQWWFNWNVNLYVIFSIVLVVLCIIKTKLNILHPLVWYVSIFVIYQIAYPLLKIMQKEEGIIEPLNDNYVILNWLATCSIIIFLGNLKHIKYRKENIETKINKTILGIMYILIISVSILGLLYTAIKGYVSKYDIAQSSNIFISITSICINMVSIITLYICLNENYSKKQKIAIFFFSFIVEFLGMGILGERDLIIKYVAVFLLYYVAIYKPKKSKIIILLSSIIVLVSISPSLKMFLVRDNEKDEDNNIVVKFLSSDFQAAGLNFNYLLNREGLWDLKYGDTLIYDFLSPLSDFINFSEEQVSTRWYQNTFFAGSITGRGFSIIAEGYINFSVFGIVVWMFIICAIIRILYLKSGKSIYSFAIYICACPMLMYIARADLANFISPFVKYVLLFTIIIYFISERKNKNDKGKQLSKQ